MQARNDRAQAGRPLTLQNAKRPLAPEDFPVCKGWGGRKVSRHEGPLKKQAGNMEGQLAGLSFQKPPRRRGEAGRRDRFS